MLKKFGLSLLAAFFSFSVLAVAVLSSTNSTLGTSDTLKESLASGETYDAAADAIINQAVKAMQKPEETDQAPPQSESPQLDPKIVEQVATRVVTPEKLRTYAEQIVDGTYHWLGGDVKLPDYNIDIAAIKTDLANALGDVAVENAEGLPVCTPTQLRTLSTSEFDPFNAPCRPPGIDLKAERAKLVSEISSSKDFMENTTITAEDTRSEDNQKTPFEHMAYIPTIFQLSQKLPWILGGLGLAAAAGIVLLNEDRRKGIKKISASLLITGVFLLVGIWLTSFAFSRIRVNQDAAAAQFQTILIDVLKTLSANFNRTLLVFAIVYAGLGIGGLLWLRFTRPKGEAPAKPEESETEPAEDKKAESEPKPAPEHPKTV